MDVAQHYKHQLGSNLIVQTHFRAPSPFSTLRKMYFYCGIGTFGKGQLEKWGTGKGMGMGTGNRNGSGDCQ